VQVLLNNFLYDIAQLTIPTDRVDPDFLSRPRRWQIGLVRRVMVRVGPISSAFDLVTFAGLWYVFHASAEVFHTGWFVESVATQVLVLFVVRTLGTGASTPPSRALVVSSIAVVAVALALPISPLAPVLGFVPLPPVLLGFIVLTVAGYLAFIWAARRHVLR
jgi:Mg2+-importing ATPase